MNYPFWPLHFDAAAHLTEPVADAPSWQRAAGRLTDLFVFSHGWNNDGAMATQLYEAFFAEVAKLPARPDASIGVAGVFWPSMLLSAPGQHQDLDALHDLLQRRPDNHAALLEFRARLGSFMRAEPAANRDDLEFLAATTSEADWQTVLRAMAGPGYDGGAAGVGFVFANLWQGALNLLRVATFWQMKHRAAIIGRNGLGPLLGQIHQATPALRIHLIGHSFGARLVSYALTGLPNVTPSPVKSLFLLQGAFSHFAFADALPFDTARHGDLAGMSTRVDGPLLATFSRKDTAIGLAYPAASIVARQDAVDAADLMYRWEGMGCDGAQEVGADCVPLTKPGTVYPFRAGHWLNLDANLVIKDGAPPEGAHGDIVHPETAWAALSAAGLSLLTNPRLALLTEPRLALLTNPRPALLTEPRT